MLGLDVREPADEAIRLLQKKEKAMALTRRRERYSATYTSETIDNGGRIKIETASPEVLAAIHDFLRFQIRDHETGDPLTIPN
jgi:hypothetical protein